MRPVRTNEQGPRGEGFEMYELGLYASAIASQADIWGNPSLAPDTRRIERAFVARSFIRKG
jgi:hypothetical protein